MGERAMGGRFGVPVRGWGAEMRRGALAMVPLWAGVIPFALAFAILARTAGFGAGETVALSALIFAGGAQVAFVTLFAGGAGATAIILTVLALNLRHILYGLSLGPRLGRLPRRARPLLAAVLTDESYGLTTRDGLAGGGGPGFFFGASLSLYGVFNLATLAGALLGGLLPDTGRLGLAFIFPLTFLALLLPLLRGGRQVLVALGAAVAVLLLRQVMPGGVAILVAAILAAGLGVASEGRGVGAGRRE